MFNFIQRYKGLDIKEGITECAQNSLAKKNKSLMIFLKMLKSKMKVLLEDCLCQGKWFL